jgi:transcriptional regulator with XRE-family HTH domain
VEAATGVSFGQLSLIENGLTERVNFNTLVKLCEFYGVPLEELFSYSTDENYIAKPSRPEAEAKAEVEAEVAYKKTRRSTKKVKQAGE